MRSRAAYPPPRLTWNRHQYDPRLKKKAQWISPLKITKISTKIDPKWRVWGTILGGRGLHFGVILGVWAGSGSQMRLGRRFGGLLGTKMGPSWSPRWDQVGPKKALKSMPKSHNFLMPLKIEFWWILGGKMRASWHPNRIQNRSQLRKADFAESVEKHTKNHCFLRFWGSKLGAKFDQKSIKNWSPS